MFDKWREGYEVVYAVRAHRQGESRFKLWTASAFYRLLRRITDVEIPVNTGDFRLIDRQVLLTMRRLREKHRFMRGLSSWVGFRQIGIEYQRAERFAGDTKYPLSKMLRPDTGCDHEFQLPSPAAQHLLWLLPGAGKPGGDCHDNSLAPVRQQRILRPGLHLGCGSVSGGIQLIFLGVIGEYLARIYDDVKARPLYVVSRAYGYADLADHRNSPTSPANLSQPDTPAD